MESLASSSLTSDIERALQHAVGEANGAYTTPNNDAGKKKKKCVREEDVADDNGSTVKEKKKKRKKADITDAIPMAGAEAAQVEEGTRKKSKKGKGKRTAQQNEQVGIVDFESAQVHANANASTEAYIDPQLVSPPNAASTSAAAFLSAVVAAASATQDQQQQPQQELPQHPYHLPSQPPPNYAPYPYAYNQYAQPSPMFPQQNMDIPFPDSMLAGASNEDILRALQDLDVSKIAQALKALGDAAGTHPGPPMSGMPQFIAPPPDERGPTPAQLGQIPQSSESILGQPSKPPARSNKQPPEGQPQHKRTLDMSLPGPEIYGNPEHAHILATKWMNASKLSELVRTEGLVYKKGKFSAIEEHQLRTAIEDYRFKNSLSPEQMHDLIFAKNEKGKENTFWSEITSAVPQRPIIAVYHHVRRSYHPMKQQGKWMKAEDDILKQAVMDLGQQWEKVSERVGRMSSDCRDRYRNHIANREVRVTGHWTKEEEDMLTQIVTEITVNQGRDVDNDVFWGVVSERMGNKRGRQQCRIKWTDSLSKTVKNEGQKPRWSQQDAFILVHKVNSLNVRDDTEIDWKILSDPHWNLWSAHSLQRRWLTMKRSIKGYEDMTHQEIMDILVVKKSHLPAEGNRGQKRKITSADTIEEDGGEAGSSTGPGTRAQGRSGSGNGTGTVNSLDAEGSTEEES